PSANHAYLAAQATLGVLYGTEDGGASWLQRPLPSLCGQLLHLSADTNGDLWALCSGASATDTQTKQLYRTTNSGMTWDLAAETNPVGSDVGALPSEGIVTSLVSVGSQRLIVVLDNGPVLVSADGGRSWIAADLSGRDVEALSFSNPQAGWAVTVSGRTYRTTNGGTHWSRVQKSEPAQTSERRAAPGPSRVGTQLDSVWLTTSRP